MLFRKKQLKTDKDFYAELLTILEKQIEQQERLITQVERLANLFDKEINREL